MSRKLRKSTDKIFGGVCAGYADYFGIDPTVVRIGFVIFTIMGGAGILIYLISWILMPNSDY